MLSLNRWNGLLPSVGLTIHSVSQQIIVGLSDVFLFVKIKPYVKGPTETHFTTSFLLFKYVALADIILR